MCTYPPSPDTGVEARSQCERESGQWSPVRLRCVPAVRSSLLFGHGPAKDVLVATVACVLLLISSASVAMASRLMFKRYLKPLLIITELYVSP